MLRTDTARSRVRDLKNVKFAQRQRLRSTGPNSQTSIQTEFENVIRMIGDVSILETTETNNDPLAILLQH